jgi:hypothetical protein
VQKERGSRSGGGRAYVAGRQSGKREAVARSWVKGAAE